MIEIIENKNGHFLSTFFVKGTKIRFFPRDLNRQSRKDDFCLNVVPYMRQNDGAIPMESIYFRGKMISAENGEILGWIVKPIYE